MVSTSNRPEAPDQVPRAAGTERSPVGELPTKRLALRMALMAAALALVGGALYGFNWYRQRAIAQFFASNRPPPTPVAVVRAKIGPMPRSLAAIGTLAAVREVTVAAEVPGTVAAIEFRSGQSVKAGQPLIRLDDRTERAELAATQAQQRLAEVTLQRAEALRERNVSPQATLDQARAQTEQLAANSNRAQVAIDRKLIDAPFDGQLGVRLVDLGQYLATGTSVVTLTDLSRLFVNFTLPEQVRRVLREGLPVEVRSDAFPDRIFSGNITAIDPQVNPGTRALRVQATMDNTERILLPGMFADVRVILPPTPAVVTLPETALIYTLYGDSVFLVHKHESTDGKPAYAVERVLVKAGERFGGQVAIERGVRAGDLAVVSGQNRLTDRAAVTISSTATPQKATEPDRGDGTGSGRP